MSLPEICSRRWREVNFKDRLLVGYRGQCSRFGVEVVAPLEALLALRPQHYVAIKAQGQDTRKRVGDVKYAVSRHIEQTEIGRMTLFTAHDDSD